MRIAVCGLVLTMIAQPVGGLDKCAGACASPQLRTAPPRLVMAVGAPIIQRVAAKAPIVPSPPKASAGRLAAVASTAAQIEILKFEHPATRPPDVLGGDRDGPFPATASPALTDGLNAQAIRIKPNVDTGIYPARQAKSPQQIAQDAWDARQQLAYVAPIAPTEFAYSPIHDIAPDELKTVPGSASLNGVEPGNEQQPGADAIQTIQNKWSQASSVPTVGQRGSFN